MERCRVFFYQLLQSTFQKITDLSGVFGQALALDDLEHLQCDRAGQRRAAIGSSMGARIEQISVRRADPERADGEAAAEGFRHGNSIRQKAYRQVRGVVRR